MRQGPELPVWRFRSSFLLGDNWLIATNLEKLQPNGESCNQI